MRDWINGGVRMLSRLYGSDSVMRATQAQIAAYAAVPHSPAEGYATLRQYYANNGLYSDVASALHANNVPTAATLPLRNPAFRVVEFYAAALAGPGEPKAENERILEPIRQVWTWSNWPAKWQVFSRWLPMLGDCFVKVANNATDEDPATRVYFQLIDPANVPEFTTDERGYLTYCRIDTPLEQSTPTNAAQRRIRTELWRKSTQSVEVYEHERPGIKTDDLRNPISTASFADAGIDFVPVVHCMFRDVGEDRGVGAYSLALDKIDEVNRKATRLAQLLFMRNDLTWILEGEATDKDRSVLSPITVTNDGQVKGAKQGNIGGVNLWALPPGWRMRDTVPQIDYRASLDAVLSDMAELQQDLPEMAYWRITEAGASDLSGRALRTLLIPAVARAHEAALNAHNALKRLDEMALTIGAFAGLWKEDVGKYEAGAFEHEFDPPDVIPLSSREQAEETALDWQTIAIQLEAGIPLAYLLKQRGLPDDEIAGIIRARDAEKAQAQERAATFFAAGQQQPPGEPPGEQEGADDAAG